MQLNVITRVFIIPQRTDDDPYRGKIMTTSSLKSFEVNNSWDELSQTANVVLSRKSQRFKIFDVNLLKDTFGLDDESGYFRYLKDIYYCADVVLNGELAKNNPLLEQQSVTNTFDYVGFTEGAYPLIKSGDFISIHAWYETVDKDGIARYTYFNNEGEQSYFQDGEHILNRNRGQLFLGYITSVNAKTEVKIECADEFFYFSQCRISTAIYDPKKWTVSALILDSIKSVSFLKNENNHIRLNPIWYDARVNSNGFNKPLIRIFKPLDHQDIRVGKITVEKNSNFGSLLKELKDKYGCMPYFYDNTPYLNILPFKYRHKTYNPDYTIGYQVHTFEFQKNIITNNLVYKKTDDLRVGGVVKTIYKVKKTTNNTTITKTQTTNDGVNKIHDVTEITTPVTETLITNDGVDKTKTSNYTVHVGDYGGDQFTWIFPSDLVDPTITQIKNVAVAYGQERLKKVNYEGYRGTITVLGWPYVRHGDEVILKDAIYTERDGTYKVKKVRYFGSVTEGLRQEVTLDWKILKGEPNYTGSSK